MGFQQGLSGLNAASKNLDVIGHNIANANTTGYKSGRAEFSALYANSLSAGGGGGSGIGVSVGAVAQQYTQGNLSITGNDLDVAINGNGFFTLQLPDGSTAYSRDGALKLDALGNIVNNSGAKLMGFPTDTTGVRTSLQTQPLTLPTGSESPPKQSTTLTTQMNLPASAVVAATATPPTPVTTYGTTYTAYDAQGLETAVGVYFVKTAANAWDVYVGYDGAAPTTTGVNVTFDSAGNLDAAGQAAMAGLTLTVPSPQDTPPATTNAYPMTLDMAKSSFTQYNNQFTVSKLSQDGYTSGSLTGLKIQDNGVITAKYSNGQTQAAGQIALANFPNVQGLSPQSGNMLTANYSSGSPVMGAAGEGKFGKIQSGALEDSNVDLTAELVNMMTAQRNYQANAQTIKTMDQVMSTLVSMR